MDGDPCGIFLRDLRSYPPHLMIRLDIHFYWTWYFSPLHELSQYTAQAMDHEITATTQLCHLVLACLGAHHEEMTLNYEETTGIVCLQNVVRHPSSLHHHPNVVCPNAHVCPEAVVAASRKSCSHLFLTIAFCNCNMLLILQTIIYILIVSGQKVPGSGQKFASCPSAKRTIDRRPAHRLPRIPHTSILPKTSPKTERTREEPGKTVHFSSSEVPN